MYLLRSCLGVFAVLGTWPNWEQYFDLSRKGLKLSFGVLVLSLAPLWLIAIVVQAERARILETELSTPNVLAFVLTVGLWLFSFPAMAYLIAMIFETLDRLRPWLITRNWAFFSLACVVGTAFGLVGLGVFPIKAAYGIAFAAYFGLLGIDIRLMQKVAGFNWIPAILLACLIVAVGLTFVLLSINN